MVFLCSVNSWAQFCTGSNVFDAILVFALGGADVIIWWMGLVLAAGNALGAWLGTHFAVKKGEKLIRTVLLLAMLGLAVKLIFFT